MNLLPKPVEQAAKDLNNKIVVQVPAGDAVTGKIPNISESAGGLNGIDPSDGKGVYGVKGVSAEHAPAGVRTDLTPSRLARSLTVAPVPVPVEGVTNRSPLAGDVGNADPIPERTDAKDTAFHRSSAKDGADRPSPAEIMARCVRETGFSAREIRKLAVEGLLHHYAERGEFTLPLTFAPPRRERETAAGPPAAPPPPPSGNDGSAGEEPETVSVLIDRRKRALLERHAATLGCDAGKLAAVLVEIEADRRAAEETRPKPKPRLTLSAGHTRRIERLAGLLDVRPETFLRWQMNDVLESLESSGIGLLESWAAEMIVYESPEERMAAIARVDAWMSRRKARALERRAA